MSETRFFQVTASIWDNPETDDSVLYSVVQDFSDTDDDHEVLADGEVETWEHAKALVRDVMKSLL